MGKKRASSSGGLTLESAASVPAREGGLLVNDIDEIAARFLRAGSIREDALARLRVFATAEGAFVYQAAEVGGKLRLASSTAAGEPAAQAMARFAALDSGALDEILASHRHPKAATSRGFIEWDRLLSNDHPQKHVVSRQVWKASGIRDVMQVLVYDGSRLAAAVGVLRTSSMFSPQDRRAINSLYETVRIAMIAADRVEREQLPKGHESIILSATGEILFFAEDARPWLSVPGFRERIGEVARSLHAADAPLGAVAHGPLQVMMSRLASAKGPSCFLARLKPSTPLEKSEDAVLSPVQREVAKLAANGATIAEIAATLGRGTETVRSHLSEVYRRLGVSTRIDLARALSGSASAADPQEITVW